METSPEISAMMFDPITLVICGVTIVGLILSLGLALKGALAITSGRAPSLLRCYGIMIAQMTAQVLVGFGCALIIPPELSPVSVFIVIVVNFTILCKLGDVGFIGAIVTNILSGIFMTIMIIAIMLGALLATKTLVVSRHPEAMAQLEQRSKSRGGAVEAWVKDANKPNSKGLPTSVGSSGNNNSFFSAPDAADQPSTATAAPSTPTEVFSTPTVTPVKLEANQQSNPFFK